MHRNQGIQAHPKGKPGLSRRAVNRKDAKIAKYLRFPDLHELFVNRDSFVPAASFNGKKFFSIPNLSGLYTLPVKSPSKFLLRMTAF
jgi:hypothetical protein